MAEKWNLDGTYMEACNCEVACPCIFTSPPTEEDCTALIAWHIDKGSFGDVVLDGLNAAMMVYTPGHMLQTEWRIALYLDDKATEAQTDALTQIYSGQAGGLFETLGGHVGEVLGVKSVAIDHQGDGKQRTLRIAGVAEARIEAIAGLGGADVLIKDQPVNLAPGNPLVVAKSQRLSYRDHGFEWEISDRNGFYAHFDYEGGG